MKRCAICLLVMALMATVVQAADDAAAKPEDQKKDTSPRVKLETTLGDIILQLDGKKAPISTQNFLQYVDEGYYDGLIFHRVLPNFMIQAGGFDAEFNKRNKGLHKPIKNESKNGLSNKRGTISMARTGAPHSATAQFFINVVDNERLDASDRMPFGYAVFGEVVEGMDVVDKIRNSKCIVHPKDPGQGREGAVNPDPTVVIKKATRVKADAEETEKKEKKEEKADD
jgi:cyclophilin family peptidyl-prolyl cis-trans isomerase